ncbi:cystathionine beta-synthase [Gramella sp. BOM4]|nr:cystathionine beta-synthase [Christiangramia bathymodioli]
MQAQELNAFLKNVLKNMPEDWLKLTTHRLDVYNESLAKTEFLDRFEKLYSENNADGTALAELPTAFDYIRLGHPLSSVLEWGIAKFSGLKPENVIAFSSRMTPILAVLRKNLFDKRRTRILYAGHLPESFDFETVKKVYGYDFELEQIENSHDISEFEGSTVFISKEDDLRELQLNQHIDFQICLKGDLGSIILVNGPENEGHISEIQHVRRRETIAMTPADSYTVLQELTSQQASAKHGADYEANRKKVENSVQEITATNSKVILGSCGLSVQYAIMMGLIDDAQEKHPGKTIKIIVPPNCYGGTNDQARRVAACLDNVEIMDLPVDRDNDMVESTNQVLEQVAREDAVPYIIAEIPTNPRVEVPDLDKLRATLSKKRKTASGEAAVEPVFILDQTFCPNVQFCGEDGILSEVKTLSYVSGSKFPSGGKCTAGYCVANKRAEGLMDKLEKHIRLCDNEATALQVSILAEQLPSMNQRIKEAYKNTREFVNFIEKKLPEAKINFVSEELAKQGFTPSVFSLDLPTKGNSEEEREKYKRALNQKLIDMMISRIPNESKYCVSYGQLKGCYWTIPATSTQGTTKETDKDYIARVSVSPDLDLEKHKQVFSDFVKEI